MLVFKLLVLVFSVIVHEIAHGYVAERLGDPTARRAGRLTLNPAKHVDPFGSVVVPLLLSLLPGGFVFGWAKPVPIDARNFKRPERDTAIASAAGPASNLLLALVFGLGIRALVAAPFAFAAPLAALFAVIVLTNLALAVFNLLPIPPLDGSGVLLALLPRRFARVRELFARHGMLIFVGFMLFSTFLGFDVISPAIAALFKLFAGVPAGW